MFCGSSIVQPPILLRIATLGVSSDVLPYLDGVDVPIDRHSTILEAKHQSTHSMHENEIETKRHERVVTGTIWSHIPNVRRSRECREGVAGPKGDLKAGSTLRRDGLRAGLRATERPLHTTISISFSFSVKRWTHNLSDVASHQRADGQRLTLAVEVDSEPRAVSAVGDAVDDVVVSTECLRHRTSDCDG